jgi:hypothetical protein
MLYGRAMPSPRRADGAPEGSQTCVYPLTIQADPDRGPRRVGAGRRPRARMTNPIVLDLADVRPIGIDLDRKANEVSRL